MNRFEDFTEEECKMIFLSLCKYKCNDYNSERMRRNLRSELMKQIISIDKKRFDNNETR